MSHKRQTTATSFLDKVNSVGLSATFSIGIVLNYLDSSSPLKNLNPLNSFETTTITSTTNLNQIEDLVSLKPRKNFGQLFEKMEKTNWYKEAYFDKTLGEVVNLES